MSKEEIEKVIRTTLVVTNHKSIHITVNKIYDLFMEESEGYAEELRFLRCLEGAGVDNWEGYDIARDMMEDE